MRTVRRWPSALTTRSSAYPQEEFPYLHATMAVFARHDDRKQFTFGLDLLLAGLQLRADR